MEAQMATRVIFIIPLGCGQILYPEIQAVFDPLGHRATLTIPAPCVTTVPIESSNNRYVANARPAIARVRGHQFAH